MEVAQLVITAVYEPLKFVAREVGNIRNLKGKMENLTKRFGELEAKERDVKRILTRAESDGRKKRKYEVEIWLNDVAAKKRELEELKNDVQQSKRYELRRRRYLSKKIAEKVQEVSNLDQRKTNFVGLVLDVEPAIVPLVTTTTASQGKAFQQNLAHILSLVMNDTVSSIGIHGMGGVGKTTLAKHVHDDLLHRPKFVDRVYFVTASQECTIRKLQNGIAKAMNIPVSVEDDEDRRAGVLYNAMKEKQEYVLILDDLWTEFDVKDIGIPSEGRKLIVTSRSKEYCRMMGCKSLIEVETLSEPEAWELFKEKNENIDQLALEVTEIAKKVAERCGGLPLGIITVARSMIGVTDMSAWKNAFVELKESLKGLNIIQEKVFPILLYSFNHLKNQTLQNCFLYCSLYPEDYEIPRDELVRKFIVEELLDKRNSRQADVDQGNAILNKLENVGLLLADITFRRKRYVKMHDLVRDMALRITRDNPRFMVKSGLQLKEIPSQDEWTEDLNKVSLMYNEISTIPDGMSPMCLSLRSLNLSNNPSLVSIPDSFFKNMQTLQTLDLSWTEIKSLPDSISLLSTLKGLLLGHCKELVSLPSLGNLKALRELDLTWTCKFHDEIGGLESLTNLKCLQLAGSSMKMMPSGTLRRLSFLQCLNLPWGNCVEVESVKSLNYLEEFRGRFADMDVLRQFLKSRNSQSQLISYDIQVGGTDHREYDSIRKLSISIEYKGLSTGEVVIGDDDVLLLQDTKELRVRYFESESDSPGGDNNIAKCILRVREDREQIPNRSPLKSIEYLELNLLPNLRNIIEVGEGANIIHPPPATFSSLKKLDISYCHKMKKVLPRCFLDNLRNLEVLEVCDCSGMEEIIGEDNEGEENNMGYDSTTTNHVPTLPKLRELTLIELSELKSIWKSNVNCNSIRDITIMGCTELKKVTLFVPHLTNDQLSPPPALQKITIRESERVWWDSLEWDHPHHKDILQPFLVLC